MSKYKKGEKFYIEVEVDVVSDKDSIWVVIPDHPKNEYDGVCVYTKDLISKKDIKRGMMWVFSALMFQP